MLFRKSALHLGLFTAFLGAGSAHAIDVSIESLGITGTFNTTVTLGAQMRMEERSEDLIGKANLDPNLCGAQYQSCQATFKDQVYPSQRLANSAGAASLRADDGNNNYDRYELTQGGIRFTQDLTFNKDSFGFFARMVSFYDLVSDQKQDFYPNLITAENFDRVGTTGDANYSNRYFTRTYGPGEPTKIKRTDSTARRQQVADIQVLDFNFFGKIPLPGTEKELSFKVGRQTVNWGESTLLVINSINQAQPVNANNLFRVGFQLEEVFRPVAMAYFAVEPYEGGNLEAYYQLEWKPVEIPTPGSFFSFADIGTDNLRNFVNFGFGAQADDNSGLGFYADNPLALVTDTSSRVLRAPDRSPGYQGQFGVALKTYFENFNNGTEIGLFFMNYHSKLPYASFIATDASCARREGNTVNGTGIDVTNTQELLQACPNLPASTVPSAGPNFRGDVVAAITANLPGSLQDLGIDPTDPLAILGLPATLAALGGPGDPNNPDNVVPLDTGKFLFEYPKNIQLYGISFNTTAGDYAFQGEVAYRPNLPLQVALIDVAFAGAGPTLTRCHDPNLDCAGSTGGQGFGVDGTGARVNYGRSDVDDQAGDNIGNNCNTRGTCDTVNLFLGASPGSARSFPSFLTAYRGGVVGETEPNSYIRGYERFDVLQYNLGITRVFGATDNPFGADQILTLFEIGATHVPGLPSLDELQIEAPGVYYHASAGADGSGADGSRQACSTNPNCVIGGDGLRFNPHQANLDAYTDKFSWGYRLVNIVKYESVLPGLSIAPFIIWSHDVNGTAPGPAENFVQGRKSVNFNMEFRYKSALSITAGYNWFFGGGENNLLHDRDNAQLFMRYQF